MYAFLHPALAQTRDNSRSNYTCTHFLIYDTPVHTWRERERERERQTDRQTDRQTEKKRKFFIYEGN